MSTSESAQKPRAFDFVASLDIAQATLEKYKADWPKWFKRIDHTPIPNDLCCRMAEAYCNSHAQLAAQNAALVEAAEHAREVLSTLYAKYGLQIGPYSSQAQQCNVELGAALAAYRERTK